MDSLFTKPVSLKKCNTYDVNVIKEVLKEQLINIGFDLSLFKTKNIVIKPNLVMRANPSAAATTHPTILESFILVALENGIPCENITIAESPGGPYTAVLLNTNYKICGIKDVADKYGVNLNKNLDYSVMHAPDGVKSKSFDIISPILNADLIVNLAKLKSHSLTKMSGAVKNYFGTVPGIQKFEMHARFPEYEDFNSMIVDLTSTICKTKNTLNITDGIIGMEGNGPTGGTPVEIGCIITSENPFNSDLVASYVLKFNGDVTMIKEAMKRGYCPENIDEVNVCGDSYKDLTIEKFKLPDTNRFSLMRSMPNLLGGKFSKFFEPRPLINEKICVGCGECVRSCPVKTIELKSKNGKKKAYINSKKCIKCYCCQELCTFRAVKIKKNLVFKIIK